MTTELETTKTFQEKMFEKIRANIGDLMTDDDLKNLVHKAVDKSFFEPRVTGEYYYNRKVEASLFQELISKAVREQIDRAVAGYVAENQEQIKLAINNCISKNFFEIAVSHFNNLMSGPLYDLKNDLQAKGII